RAVCTHHAAPDRFPSRELPPPALRLLQRQSRSAIRSERVAEGGILLNGRPASGGLVALVLLATACGGTGSEAASDGSPTGSAAGFLMTSCHVLHDCAMVASGTPLEVFTPDLPAEVFGVRAAAVEHPSTGDPLIAFDHRSVTPVLPVLP
ncbi:hypothetical protein ABTZ94_34230, partial [Streptomyces sp. NPDC002785]